MKKALIVLALVLVLVAPLSAARYTKTNGVGVGLSAGWPVAGVAFKYGMNDFRVVGTLGYDYRGSIALEAGAQYDVYQFDIADIPFYLNVGITASASAATDFKSFAFTGNVPVGVSYFFEQIPIEAFLKVGPGVKYADKKIGFDINAAIGALWYLD
ncbi:MAG: hypothetical protein WDA17_05930 [Sphaerochaetaceae bacterium]